MRMVPKYQGGGKPPIGTQALYDHVTTIYQSLVDKGIPPLAALDLVNLKVAEKGWTGWATGDNKKYDTVDGLTDHIIDWHGRMYPESLNATDFDSFYKGIMITPKFKYNPHGLQYKKLLLKTRPGVKKRINFYRELLNLPPLSYNPTSVPMALAGVKLNKRQLDILARSESGETAGNYSKAVDGDLMLSDSAIHAIDYINYHTGSNIPTGASNCTLTASLWVNPNIPISKALTIMDNPTKYGFIPIPEAHVLPGDLVIATNPQLGNHHTMLVSGFALSSHKHTLNGKSYDVNAGDILTRYSNGSTVGGYRQGVPLNAYIDLSHGKTLTDYYRFSPVGMDPQVLLPEIVVTPNGSYVPKGLKTIRIK